MREFTLKPEHIKLLSKAIVEWDDSETGAPAINPKRPYGNSGVAGDVAEILGVEVKKCPHCDEPLDEQDDEKLLALHRETETALQIVLCTQSFVPGTYAEIDYNTWKRKQ